MTSWPTSDYTDEEDLGLDSDRYYFGRSSVPKMRQSRKRSCSSAGLVDSFVEDFERRLKLTPSTLQRLKVADGFLKDSKFVLTLMKFLPESCVRKLAMTCSQWQTLAYKTLREKQGNNAFSLLWISDDVVADESQTEEFDFKMFFHQAHLGGVSDTIQNFQATEVEMPLVEIVQGNCESGNLENVVSHSGKGNPQLVSTKKVGFILTYGSSSMESDLMAIEQDDNKTMKAATIGFATLLVLSPSILVTTPDGRMLVDTYISEHPYRKLITSILFPQSTHILFECFIVPSSPCESTPVTVSNVVGTYGSSKKPKALILYQYLNLIDSKPGIVEVLQSLRLSQDSAGFPMVTGIYNYLDANLKTTGQSIDDLGYPVATGLLVCGDDFCNISVLSINLTESQEANLEKIKGFYDADKFTSKYALLFYHNEVTNSDSSGQLHFKNFVHGFRMKLPNVKLHGIGSLSGAHAMFVDPYSNQSFNQLNERMMGLTGTVESKTSPYIMELTFVLLSYQAE